jgi:hypothetical protein
MNWHELCVEGVLLPGHVSSSFLWSALSPTTFDPTVNFVSAVNLVHDCPSSLLTVLADSHPDREVWLQSYFEEKRGIESRRTYKKLSFAQYHALHEKGAPKAIPMMCILTINLDEMLNPFRAKAKYLDCCSWQPQRSCLVQVRQVRPYSTLGYHAAYP